MRIFEMSEMWQKIRVLLLVVLPLAAVVAAIILFWNQYVHAKDLFLLVLFEVDILVTTP